MYDVAKSRVITLWETLHPQSRTFKKSDQHNLRDNELRELASWGNTRNMTKYRVPIKCIDKLARRTRQL
jgi:hypothetical protein